MQEIRDAKARYDVTRPTFQHAKAEFDQSRAEHDRARDEHERTQADFKRARSEFDSAENAFQITLSWLRGQPAPTGAAVRDVAQ